MLSISAMASGQASYYLELGRTDYFLDGGEPPGRWHGSGAKALGVTDRVGKSELRSLFDGHSPDGGSELVQTSRGHQPGWDLTFSAPKSVSVAWGVGERSQREAIQEAHDAAVAAALDYLEDAASFSRRGRGGQRAEKAGLCAALFQHGTSRAEDPQLHTHALVLNVASRGGGFGTLRSRDLYQHKMAAGALYRSELAGRLQALGYTLEGDRTAFRLAEVPRHIEEHFSKRRAQIRQALTSESRSGPKAAELAALKTRDVKGHVARAGLHARWREESALKIAPSLSLLRTGPNLAKAARDAVSRLEASRSHFLERDLVREVARLAESRGGASIEKIRAAVRAALQGRQVRCIGEVGEYRYYATAASLEREGEVLAQAERLHARRGHGVKMEVAYRAAQDFPTLRPEQRAALEHLTRGEEGLALLDGLAGTGKTYLLNAARETWERAGYRVRGAAVTGRAATGLEDGAGIASRTIASLLLRLKKAPLSSKDVLVIDEAGMAGVGELTKLLSQARKAGAKVCLVGDYRQLPSIEHASPFRHLCERYGAAQLREVARQEQQWERDALLEVAEGDVRTALSSYAAHGRLRVCPDKSEAMGALLEHWTQTRTKDLADTLVLTATNKQREALNRHIQRRRLRAGELKASRFVEGAGRRFYAGDRVVFTANNRAAGYQNGSLGTVESYERRVLGTSTMVVRLDRYRDGQPLRVLVPIGEDVELGYALTVHKSQGATVKRAMVLGGGFMQTREQAYVQLSRATQRTDLFLSEEDAGEDLSELARYMERQATRELARDAVERESARMRDREHELEHGGR